MMAADDPRVPFTIEAFGRFAHGQVRVAYDPSPRPTTDALERLINAEWKRRTAAAASAGVRLFNGELFRYVAHDVLRGYLSLTVGATCYRDFVGTNLYNGSRLSEFGRSRFANPVGTTATLLTADGFVVYGRRSGSVAYHAGYVHTFGGTLEIADRRPDGRIDVFASVARELTEEAGIVAADLEELVCVGLIRDREIHQPELLFEARLRLTLAELLDRVRDAEAREEHSGISVLMAHPSLVVPFIGAWAPIAPVAVGALILFGRRAWGEQWSDKAALALVTRMPVTLV